MKDAFLAVEALTRVIASRELRDFNVGELPKEVLKVFASDRPLSVEVEDLVRTEADESVAQFDIHTRVL